jgi:hypothetical protein
MIRPAHILAAAVTIAVLLAVIDVFWSTATPGALDLLASFAFAVCAFTWVKADARARQIRPPAGAALLAGLIIPVGVPMYLFSVLGFRRGLWATVKALGFILAVGLVYVSVAYVAELVAYLAR